MPHHLELLDNFPSCLAALPSEEARKQVGSILAALEENRYFAPCDGGFDYERTDQGMVCRHHYDWGDWKMVVGYRYSRELPSTVIKLMVRLVKEKTKVETLLPEYGHR